MDDDRLDDFLDDFPLLIEAGFIAVKQLDEINATRIFNAAQAISPRSTAPQIGLGYIALNKLELKEATKLFEGVLSKEPDNLLAQTFLGISQLLNKNQRAEGEKLIRDAMEKSTDSTVKTLGAISLEWAEKDLKKKESPFFAVAEEKKGEE
jgi:predicted Zn-dependent protease